MHVTIRGKRYELRFEKMNPEYLGLCDPPNVMNKKITVESNQGEREFLDTLIQELMHAAYWDIKEDAIDEGATDVATVLWRLGYRRKVD